MVRNSLVLFLCLVSALGWAQTQAEWLVEIRHPSSKRWNEELSFPFSADLLVNEGLISVWQTSEKPSQVWIAEAEAKGLQVHVEPNYPTHALIAPNDAQFDQQWSLNNRGQFRGKLGADISAQQAWQVSRGDRSVVVGVIDTGVDWQHPDLIQNIWQNLGEDLDQDGHVLEWNGSQWQFDPDDENGIDDDGNGYADDFIGWDFVDNDNNPMDEHIFSHGTHVAGIIGAEGGNRLGISGVAPQVSLMIVRNLDRNGVGVQSQALLSLDYAVANGALISNNSWGSPNFSPLMEQAIDRAAVQNHLLVAAAGNNFGNDNDVTPIYPAGYTADNIITVTATNNLDQLASFANIGAASVDVAAPGEGIYSTTRNGQYGFMSGTSMAAPLVTGGLVLHQAVFGPQLPLQVKEALIRSVDVLPDLNGTCRSNGRLNAYHLVNDPVYFQRQLEVAGEEIVPISNGDWIIWGQVGDSAFVRKYNRKGIILWEKRLADLKLQKGLAQDSVLYLAGIQDQQPGIHWLKLNAQGDILLAETWQGQGEIHTIDAYLSTPTDHFLAGTSILGQDTIGWLVKKLINGNIAWTQAWENPKETLHPVEMALEAEHTLWLQVGEEKRETGVLRFSLDDGGLVKGQTLRLTTEGFLRPLGVITKEEEEASLIYQVISPNGTQHVNAWDLEEDEIEEGWKLNQGEGATLSAYLTIGERGEQLLWATYQGGGGQGAVLSNISNGELVAQQAFAWPTIAQARAAVWHPREGLGLLTHVGEEIIWTKTDAKGQGVCGISPYRIPLQRSDTPIVSDLVLNPVNLSFQRESYVVATKNASGTDSIICDNSQCEVRAFFELPRFKYCEEETLLPIQRSQQAAQFQWILDGFPIATGASPPIQLGDDAGLHRLTLEAISGTCIDTFGLTLEIEAKPEFESIDTNRCAPLLRLEAPTQSSLFTYSWRDENNIEFSDSPVATFRQSGEYKLVITDVCGNEAEETIGVSLDAGCVWPGDVNVDGFVNLLDFLVMGGINGASGPARMSSSTNFLPQAALPWNQRFPNNHPFAPSIDYVHADCDGNGVVDLGLDGQVVAANYTYDPYLSRVGTGAVDLSFQLDQSRITLGDTLQFAINLEGQGGTPIPEGYGLAVTLAYNLPLSERLQVDLSNSWLGTQNQVDSLIVWDQRRKRVYLGISRNNQIGQVGSGIAIQGGITVMIDNIGSPAALSEPAFLTFSVIEALFVDKSGRPIPLNGLEAFGTQTVEITGGPDSVVTTLSPHELTPLGLRIGPNPAYGQTFIHFTSPPKENMTLKLLDQQGRIVRQQTYEPTLSLSFDLQACTPGVYWLVCSVGSNALITPLLVKR